MRMTKVIRDYITDEIKAKYQPYIDALSEKYHLDADRKAIQTVKNEVEEVAKKMFTEKLAPYYDPADLQVLMGSYSIYAPNHWGINERGAKQYQEEKGKLLTARDKAIKEILITMELGGTKEQLDEMLAKINPEAV